MDSTEKGRSMVKNLLVLGILLGTIFLAGCTTVDQVTEEPDSGWPFADMVQNDPATSAPSCGAIPLEEPPTLAGVKVFGLENSGDGLPPYWLPGMAFKVNWVLEEGYGEPMEVTLRRPGGRDSVYSLRLHPRPSLLALPGPGCWDLTVEFKGRSESRRIYVPPARPVGFRTESVVWRTNVIPLLDSAASRLAQAERETRQPSADRRGFFLDLLWQVGDHPAEIRTPVLYLPAAAGREPALAMPRSILTGVCGDTTPVVVPLSGSAAGDFARHFSFDGERQPLFRLQQRYSAQCDAF